MASEMTPHPEEPALAGISKDARKQSSLGNALHLPEAADLGEQGEVAEDGAEGSAVGDVHLDAAAGVASGFRKAAEVPASARPIVARRPGVSSAWWALMERLALPSAPPLVIAIAPSTTSSSLNSPCAALTARDSRSAPTASARVA